MSKIVTLERLLAELGSLRQVGLTIVLTNGCFDLLHVRHVRYLQTARAKGDILVVGLNTDAGVRALKGPGRPLMPQDERAEILAALACVDYVILFSELTAENLVRYICPDVYATGDDWTAETLPEGPAVRQNGGRIEIIPGTAGRSTSDLIQDIVANFGGKT